MGGAETFECIQREAKLGPRRRGCGFDAEPHRRRTRSRLFEQVQTAAVQFEGPLEQ
jgi:hypothetical protein